MTPREYTLLRIILLGIDIKAREGRDSYKVDALRELYLAVKSPAAALSPHFAKIRSKFIGADLVHLDRILVDEAGIARLTKL